jgi:hypothetical protein
MEIPNRLLGDTTRGVAVGAVILWWGHGVSSNRIDGPICVIPSPTAGELQQLLEDSKSSFGASQVTRFVTVPRSRIWSEVPMSILERLLVEEIL